MFSKINLQINYSQFINCKYPDYEFQSIDIINDNNKNTIIENFCKKLPETFCWENTRMKQRFWQNTEIDFNDISSKLNMEVITISSILQPPGSILPLHIDSFYQLRKKYPNKKNPMRAIIFLEDWKLGHFLQYENNVETHWQQGQGIIWGSNVYHLSANAGIENKYTLQVSGFTNE